MSSSNHQLEELKKSRLVTELKSKRVGLVLCGGGAKGAHQAGALKLLHDLEITRFHKISGVSVGALNAGIATSGKLGEIDKVWKNLSFFDVVRPSIGILITIPALIVSSLMRTTSTLHPMQFLLIGSAISFTAYILFDSTIFLVFFLALFILSYYTPLFGFLVRGMGYFLEKAVFRRFALSSQLGLHKLIHSILDKDFSTQCPTLVTLSIERRWFDPDDPKFVPLPFGKRNIYQPNENFGILPSYFDLSGKSIDEIKALLSRSAGLPFVFREKLYDGKYYLDGGLVENCPINPLLDGECDYIVVLSMSDRSDDKALSLSQVPRLRRAIDLEKSGLKNNHDLYLNWCSANYDGVATKTFDLFDLPIPNKNEIVPTQEINVTEKIVWLQPSKKLGGFFQGTLNFRNSRTKRIFDLGYSDMKALLQTGDLT